MNLLDREIRADWASRLQAVQTEYLILDCLRPVLDALGLDEQREAGRFLVAFDQLLRDEGVPDRWSSTTWGTTKNARAGTPGCGTGPMPNGG